jgi:hypothetical protein
VIRLKGAHRGERAAVVFGGPSLIAGGFDFRLLRDRGFVTFVETKALTPRLLEGGFAPDYYLLLFPEKSKDNALQHFVYRSLLANTAIEPMLKPEFRAVPRLMRERFDEYFEGWKPERGPHKTYRWRPDVFLPGSPYDLLARATASRVIVNRTLVDAYYPTFAYADRAFYFQQEPGATRFDPDQYFNPHERDGEVFIRCADTFLNSAAIALYPLLNYMGFREVYFLGMDMSMLGSLEYAAPFTFRSMLHFWWFFRRTRRVFNANYVSNGWFFRRPQSEFDDLRRLWSIAPLKFMRVYDPWRYATPIANLPTLSTARFQTH